VHVVDTTPPASEKPAHIRTWLFNGGLPGWMMFSHRRYQNLESKAASGFVRAARQP
jgi:hypothetical protein